MATQIKPTIAAQTLIQLGGRRFIAMTGAQVMSSGENNETLIVKFKGCRNANIMYITLTDADLYDIRICKYKIGCAGVTTIAEATGLYCDQLRPFFTKTTGLQTSL